MGRGPRRRIQGRLAAAVLTALAAVVELAGAPATGIGRGASVRWGGSRGDVASARSRAGPETRGARVAALRALRGGKQALARKGTRRAKPWVRMEDYEPDGGAGVERRRQGPSAGSERRRERASGDWYGAKAKEAEAKTKKWIRRSREDRDEDSCDEPALELRSLSDKLEQRLEEQESAGPSAPPKGGKHLIVTNALKEKVFKLAMKLGRKLERRKRFADAHAAYSKAFFACPSKALTLEPRVAMERAAIRSARSKKKRQVRRFLTSAAGGDREPITLEALERKRLELGVLTDAEALWYSVLLNETMLGQPPPQKMDPVTMQLPIGRWIPPSLRRPTSFTSAASYSRPTRTSSNVAAAVARGASEVTYTSDRVPRSILDGRTWAYFKDQPSRAGAEGAGREAGAGRAARPMFYLPSEAWPSSGPCLFCFSVEHVTKAHAAQGKQSLVIGKAPTSDESKGEGGQEDGQHRPHRQQEGAGAAIGRVEEEDEETDEGSEDSDVKSRREVLRARVSGKSHKDPRMTRRYAASSAKRGGGGGGGSSSGGGAYEKPRLHSRMKTTGKAGAGKRSEGKAGTAGKVGKRSTRKGVVRVSEAGRGGRQAGSRAGRRAASGGAKRLGARASPPVSSPLAFMKKRRKLTHTQLQKRKGNIWRNMGTPAKASRRAAGGGGAGGGGAEKDSEHDGSG